MTPVACWRPQDLYAAIDRARWAWQQTQPQMALFDGGALDEADDGMSVRLLERVPSAAACVPPRDALQAGVGPCHEPPPREEPRLAAAFVTDTSLVSPTPSLPTTRDGASLVGESRAVPQEGV